MFSGLVISYIYSTTGTPYYHHDAILKKSLECIQNRRDPILSSPMFTLLASRLLLLCLAVHLASLAPNTLPNRSIIILHGPITIRSVISVDVTAVPPVLPIFIFRFHVLHALSLLFLRRRDAAGAFRARIVKDASGAAGGLASGYATLASSSAAFGVALRTDVVDDLEPSHHFLLSQLHRRMAAAVPVTVEGKAAVPAAGLGLAFFGGRTGGLDGTRPDGAAGFTRRLGTDAHAIVVQSDHLALLAGGTGPYHLPSTTEDAFLGHLDVSMEDAASVLIVLSVGRGSTTVEFTGQ